MKVEEVEKKKVTLSLSREELLILHQALNEVLNGLDVPELSTRMGAEREEVATLMQRLRGAIGEAKSAA